MAVRVRGKYLVIDFRCYLPDGRRVRCTESEGLNNKKNLKRVQQKNRAIQYHLKEGSFDYLKFFPLGPKAKYFQKSASDMIFDDWWDRWISTLSIKESTERCYQQWYKKIIKPHFGQCRLADISQDDILVFRRSLESQLAPTSIWMNRNLQWNPNTMGLAFRHWLKMAGIKHRPPKMMRHTFATLHLAAGENITWVSKMLGHSDSQVTWKKYNRFIPNLTRNDGSAFEALMGQNGYNLVTSSSK